MRNSLIIGLLEYTPRAPLLFDLFNYLIWDQHPIYQRLSSVYFLYNCTPSQNHNPILISASFWSISRSSFLIIDYYFKDNLSQRGETGTDVSAHLAQSKATSFFLKNHRHIFCV